VRFARGARQYHLFDSGSERRVDAARGCSSDCSKHPERYTLGVACDAAGAEECPCHVQQMRYA
jgi:hypothetical protein